MAILREEVYVHRSDAVSDIAHALHRLVLDHCDAERRSVCSLFHKGFFDVMRHFHYFLLIQ